MKRTRPSSLSSLTRLSTILALIVPAIACAPATGSHPVSPPGHAKPLIEPSPALPKAAEPSDPDDAAVQKAGQEYIYLLVEI